MFEQLDEDRMFAEPLIGSLSMQQERSLTVLETPLDAVEECPALVVGQDVLDESDAVSFQ